MSTCINRRKQRRTPRATLKGFSLLLLPALAAKLAAAEPNPNPGPPHAPPATNAWKKVVMESGGSYPAPSYPAAAMKKKLQGTVAVEVVVATNGLPTKVKVHKSSGQTVLDEAAVDCVKNKWRFPAGETC